MRLQTDPYALQAVIRSNQRRERIVQMKKTTRYRALVCLLILFLGLLFAAFLYGYHSARGSYNAAENGSASAALFPASLQHIVGEAFVEPGIGTDCSDTKMTYNDRYFFGQTLRDAHVMQKTTLITKNSFPEESVIHSADDNRLTTWAEVNGQPHLNDNADADEIQKTQKETVRQPISVVTPEMFGAVGDGITDDTAALRAMMDYLKSNESTGYLTKEYFVDSIEMPNNCHLIANGGVLRKIPRNESSYNIIRMNDNCTLEGLTLIGDREYNSSDGQWGCCIFIAGRNCKIIDCNVISPHGDGIYVHSDNTVIKDCSIEKAYRNGISVTHGCNFLIADTVISNVHGHDPQFGIDLEPNNAEDQIGGSIINVSIIDCLGGIMIYKNSKQTKQFNIVCDGVRIINVKGKAALSIRNNIYTNDKYAFNDLKIINPKPETDCLAKFVFYDKNNPTLFVDATVIGGNNPNGVSLICKEQSCDNPISIRIMSEGWSRTAGIIGRDISVDSSNPNIVLSTNLAAVWQ